MKNLMTQKFVFGLLMAFVLVFGVQSVTDAANVSLSGDGSTTSSSSGTSVITVSSGLPGSDPNWTVERSFTIQVNGAKNSETVTISTTNATVTEVKVTSAPTPQTKFDDNSNSPTGTDAQITPAKGGISGPPTTITFDGLGRPDSATATGNWTIKVTYYVRALGEYKVTIDGTADSEVSGSPIKSYVVRSDSQARDAKLAIGADTTDTPVTTGSDITVDAGATWTRVDLTVAGGKLYLNSGVKYLSGSKIYEVTGGRKYFTGTLSMYTETNDNVEASVLSNENTTAKVTAKIPGSRNRGATHTITYFYNTPTVEKVSGDKQFGSVNQGTVYTNWRALPQQLVVRVVDGSETNKGVGGQWVQFTATNPTFAPRFRTASRALVWDGGDGKVTSTEDNIESLIVKTDSSGYAKVHLLPGTAAETYEIDYTLFQQTAANVAPTTRDGLPTSDGGVGTPHEDFEATAIHDTATTRDYVIDRDESDTTPQILRSQGDTEMTVNVNVSTGGADASNAQVDFSVTGGRITLTEGTNYQTRLSTVTSAASGSEGDAKVWVQANRGSIAIVTARIVGNNEDSGRHVVTFLHNGPYIERVSGDNQKGATGGRVENPLVVRVLDGRGGSPIPNQIVKFAVADPPTNSDHSTSIRQFIPVPGTNVFITNSRNLDTTTGASPASGSSVIPATLISPRAAVGSSAKPIFVQTDSNGEAKVYLELGSGDDPSTLDTTEATDLQHTVTATTPKGAPSTGVTFRADAVVGLIEAKLEIVSGDGQSAGKGDPLPESLVVRVRTVRGYLLANVLLKFTALDGSLFVDDKHDTIHVSPVGGIGNEIRVRTGSDGEAWVGYNVGQLRVARNIDVEVVEEQGAHQYDFQIDEVKFGVNGGRGTGSTTQPTQPTRQTTVTPYLQLSISPSSGAAGSTGTLTVTAYGSTGSAVPGVQVSLSSTGITLPSSVTSGQSTSFTFPSSTTSVTATANGYTRTSNNITVTGPTTTQETAESIEIVSGNNQTGEPGEALASPFTVRVEDASGDPIENAPVKFRITSSFGGSLSTRGDLTDDEGEVDTILTFGLSAGTYTVEVEATEIDEDVTFTATAVPTPAKVEIVSGDAQEGSPGSPLLKPFVVKVTDKRKEPIAGETVTFREISNLGEFNNTTSSTSVTDAQGVAESPRMTIADGGFGALFVRATAGRVSATFKVDGGDPPADLVSVSGNNQSAKPEGKLKAPFVVKAVDAEGAPFEGALVTFKVTGGGGKLSATSVKTDAKGLAQTFLTVGKERGENTVQASTAGVSGSVTFTAISGAEVLVGPAQRAPMYWISKTEGKLHRLVGEGVENLLPNVKGVTSLAVDTASSRLYFTVRTGANSGAIRSANLNGSNVQTLKTVAAVPKGIAVGGGHIYWINDRGSFIPRMTTTGKQPSGFVGNVSNPTSLVFANGYLYWSESAGFIRRVSTTTRSRTTQTLVRGIGTPLDIAITGGKVYWLERGSGTAGLLRRVDVSGANLQGLKTFTVGMPRQLAVDADTNRLYWSRNDKLQHATLFGRSITNLVSGLPVSVDLALGVSAATGVTPGQQTAQTTTQQTTQTTTYSKYDINKDGAVNNADTRAVAAAIGQSGSDITNARTDVDGSGTVDVTDIILVLGNLDDDVAAPSIDVDFKALDLDFDRVQEQIEVLLSSGDRSIAAQRALLYLQHLLASARPDETVLLANYPNPFNPETWIPYHLSESRDVKIRIYDSQGVLVRALTVGHQPAGYYTSRSRAAYWDGRNALGERVASGIYFYQLETDAISPMRKMVILK